MTPQQASCLLCHKHVDLAITCIGSLLRYSAEPIQPIFHDDGSLTADDSAKLKSAFPHSRVILKVESDSVISEKLKKHPASAKFRQSNLFALKILDPAHLTEGQTLVYCDSDILFFRPFTGLATFPSSDVHALFMLDFESCYSVRSWQLLFSRDLRLTRRVNAGLIAFRRSHLDLDKLEWYLAQKQHLTKPYFTEQTAWAMLGVAANCRLWDPRQITLLQPGTPVSSETVAAHFVGKVRHTIADFYKLQAPSDTAPVTIRTIPAQPCRSIDLAWNETTRITSRVLHKLGLASSM